MIAADTVSLGSQPKIGDIAVTGANPNAGKTNLDAKDFMKLLTVQLTNQDPMNPMKDTEFISQMANFTSLEQTRSMAEAFQRFTAEQTISSAANYLGQQVTVQPPQGNAVNGTVEAVVIREGKPQIIVGGTAYEPRFLTSIGNVLSSSAASGSSSAPASGPSSAPASTPSSSSANSTTPTVSTDVTDPANPITDSSDSPTSQG